MHLNILFVCSGNTCRSPMAKVIFRKIDEEDDILHNKVDVDSAGISADYGIPTSYMARIVIKEFGLSLDDHVSKPVSENLME